jgi:hypothetical protein
MTSATWLDARMWRMRAAEIRALADDMNDLLKMLKRDPRGPTRSAIVLLSF